MYTEPKDSKVTIPYLIFLVSLTMDTIGGGLPEIFLIVIYIIRRADYDNIVAILAVCAALKLFGLIDSHIILFQEDHVKKNKTFHIFMMIFGLAINILLLGFSFYYLFNYRGFSYLSSWKVFCQ